MNAGYISIITKFSSFFILGTTGVSTALVRGEFKLCILPCDHFIGRIITVIVTVE